MGRPTATDARNERRFWSKVKKTEDCWLWIDSNDFWAYGKNLKPHRYSLEIHLKRKLNGRFDRIIRSCNNPKCVNPSHLRIQSKEQDKKECKDKGLPYPQRIIDRFWARVQKRTVNECWLWKAGRYTDGYGYYWTGTRGIGAHRFALEVHLNSKISDDLCVLHNCDNPSCCNPNHLSKGTKNDNNQDKIRKGRDRNVSGEMHPGAKLTEKKVLKLRRLWKSGEWTYTELAKLFDVSEWTVDNIIKNKTWRYLSNG